jgi:preprotein translocase subunit SecG
MLTGLLIFHVVICILLTIVVLLQFGKGAEVGAIMGSGQSQNIFSSNSKGNFFTKMTTVLAITFMVNSIILSIMKSKDAKISIFDDEAPKARALNRDNLKAPKADAKTAPKADVKVEAKAPVKKETKK